MDYLEMVSRMGAGSAHPGGFTATLKLLGAIPLPPGCDVLEAGCGTGRTACYLAGRDCRVTGIDIRPDMIAKAEKRSRLEGVSVRFDVGDITALPYPDRSFDVILSESVTNFADLELAASEYFRVLREGGTLYCREVLRTGPIEEENQREIMDFFGFRQLLTAAEWVERLKRHGFRDLQILDPVGVDPDATRQDEAVNPDEHQFVTENAYTDYRFWRTSLQYIEMIDRYKHALGSAVLTGVRPPAARG